MEQTSANHDDEMGMYGISAVERNGQRGGRGAMSDARVRRFYKIWFI